jgi:hypothetical protein
MGAHGNLLNNPNAVEQFQAVAKVPAAISIGSHAAPNSLTAPKAGKWRESRDVKCRFRKEKFPEKIIET